MATKEGHLYLITFTEYHIETTESLNVPVVNVIIAPESSTEAYNNAGTFNQIAACINSYLDENDVILFCYCDKGEIKKSLRRRHLSNEEYRSMLFDKMFDKQSNTSCINKKFIIEASEEEKHFIHLICKQHNHDTVTAIAEEINRLNDKV